MREFQPRVGATLRALRGRMVTATEVLSDGLLIAESDRIVWAADAASAAGAGFTVELESARRVASDNVILPGLVDGHCHGGGGASFPDSATEEEASRAAQEHLRHGTTTLIASLVTADRENLLRQIKLLAALCERGELAGIHLEGPFLSPERCGAQDPAHMRAPAPQLVDEVARAARGYFTTMTIAPELLGTFGSSGIIAALARANSIPALGHTDADYQTTERAIDAAREELRATGSRVRLPIATHLFNGMRPLHHRDPGPVAACLAAAASDRMIVELIADGTHLAPDTVRAVFQMVHPANIMLVTDAMAAAGMPDGEYDLGPARVRVSSGVARLWDGDAIAGGTSHLLDVVRATVAAGVSLADAVTAASRTPARALGFEQDLGALQPGLRADAVVVDADLRPVAVARAGRWVHSAT